MKKTLFLASIAAWIFNPVMASVTYSDFGMSFVDSANKVYYEGGGHFIVQSGGVTELDLTIDLDSFYNYVNLHDYAPSYMLKWDSTFDYGLYEQYDTVTNADTGATSNTPRLLGAYDNNGLHLYSNHSVNNTNYTNLATFDTDKDGKVTLHITNSNSSDTGVSVTIGETEIYKATGLAFSSNTTTSGYYINTQYVSSITLHTASTLDTTLYETPDIYKSPYETGRTDNTSIGRVTFIGDSITHGVQTLTHRWQLFKTLVDNGIEFEIAGPLSGHDSKNGAVLDSDTQSTTYGDTAFINNHLAQSSGRSYEIINDNNSRYSGISTRETADVYNSNTWICLMGTNDLLSDVAKGALPAVYAQKMSALLGGSVSVSGDGAGTSGSLDWDMSWTPGGTEDLGNMGTIASDVMREDSDTMYVLSIPVWCDANSKHGTDAPSFQATEKYNQMLYTYVERWNADKSEATRGNMVYVETNRGLRDVTSGKFHAKNDFFRTTNNDGLHPNEQGNLIMAGNLAQAMGIGGRTAGLERKGTRGWSGASIGTVADGMSTLVAENAFTMADGYTIDFSANAGNGATDEWLAAENALSIALGDGTNSGTLNLSEGYITWEAAGQSKLLFCWDNSTLAEEGNLRVAWHNGNAADNVLSGYYVWLGDMLIGQGLDAEEGTGLNGIQVSANGTTGSITGLTWADTAYAPTTQGSFSAGHAYLTTQDAPSVSNLVSNRVSLTTSGKDFSAATTTTYTTATATVVSSAVQAAVAVTNVVVKGSGNLLVLTNQANTGEVNVRLTGSTTGFIYGAKDSASGGALTIEVAEGATINGGNTGTIYSAIAGSYNGAQADSFHVYLNGGTVGNGTPGYGDIVGGAAGGTGSIGDVRIVVNGSTVRGDVLGGSKTAGTVGNASIIVTSGTVEGSIIAGGTAGSIGNTSVTITGGEIKGDITKGDAARYKAGATASVTVEGNSARIGGNITADKVTLRGVTASGNENGFDNYTGTITTRTLTLDNVKVELKATLNDGISELELSNDSNTSAVLGDKYSLSRLQLGDDTTFSAFKDGAAANSTTSEYESELTVTTLEVGTGATLNANLVFAAGSVLIMEDYLAMGSDVALTTGMSLTLSDSMLQELYGANGVTLFTGVDKLTLDGTEIIDGSSLSANGVFSNLDSGYDYGLSYSNGAVSLQAIPEPATATLSLAALALLTLRRRRGK